MEKVEQISKIKAYNISDIYFYQEGPGVRKWQFKESGVKLLNVGNINNGKIDLSSTKINISEEEAYNKYSHFLIDEGDLLIACSGIVVENFHNKIAFVNKENLPLCLNTSTMRFKQLSEKKGDLTYLKYFLQTKLFKGQLSKLITGSAQLNFGPSHIRQIQIPLPPIATQQKIAEILDTADQLRQYNKQLIEKYDALTQSLFLDMFGDPVRNEKGWEKMELKNCTSKIGSGSTPRGGKEAYHTEGISLIRSLNIYDNEFKYKNLAFINDDQATKLKNVTVESNDVLFNITGASVCRCTVVPDDVLPARVNQHVSILRPISHKLHPLFLSHLLISENIKIQLLGVGSAGGAIMEAITKEQLEKFKIPVPPISLQTQFAERVQMIEAQKQQAQEALTKSEALFQSLLQRAFKGELN
jgi:type I restriction enzyme S subunit